MTLIWLALCWSLTVDKCSSTTLLSTCRRYEIIYFVHSENSQGILRITFTKTHIQIYSNLSNQSLNLITIKPIYLSLSLSQWHATLNQSSHEQLVCLEALLVNEFLLFLSMLQRDLRMLLSHETSTRVNNFVNELSISQTRSSRCWSS